MHDCARTWDLCSITEYQPHKPLNPATTICLPLPNGNRSSCNVAPTSEWCLGLVMCDVMVGLRWMVSVQASVQWTLT